MKYGEENTMWIRSQDRKKLVKCSSFSIVRNWGGNKNKAIVGKVSDLSLFGREIVLWLYDNEEIALNELSLIQKELVKNTDLYEMNWVKFFRWLQIAEFINKTII